MIIIIFVLIIILVTIILISIIVIFIKVLLPLFVVANGIASTERNLRTMNDEFISIKEPAEIGMSIHVNSVNMPEAGFIAVYRDDLTVMRVNNTQANQTAKFFGSSKFLPKGRTDNLNLDFTDEINCERIMIGFYKDLDNDGTFTEEEYHKSNQNGVGWILDPRFPQSSMRIIKRVDVECSS